MISVLSRRRSLKFSHLCLENVAGFSFFPKRVENNTFSFFKSTTLRNKFSAEKKENESSISSNTGKFSHEKLRSISSINDQKILNY